METLTVIFDMHDQSFPFVKQFDPFLTCKLQYDPIPKFSIL